jgi:hypothetical protein
MAPGGVRKPDSDDVETAKSESKKPVLISDDPDKAKLSPVVDLLRLVLIATLNTTGDLDSTWLDAVLFAELAPDMQSSY